MPLFHLIISLVGTLYLQVCDEFGKKWPVESNATKAHGHINVRWSQELFVP